MMKKLTAMLMAAVLTFTLTAQGAVFAAADDGLQKAITLAKSKFEVSDDLSVFRSDIRTDAQGVTTYSLNWNTDTSDGDYTDYRYVSVEIQNGYVIRYYKGKNYDGERGAKLPAYDKEQLKAKAIEHIKHIDDSVVSQIDADNANVYTGGVMSADGSVSFTRIINGIKCVNDYLSVGIDLITGELTNYNCDWNRAAAYPDPSGVLDINSAQKAYLENIGVELVYANKMDKNHKNTNEAYLLYQPKKNNSIDAKTGKIIENEYNYYPVSARDSVPTGAIYGKGEFMSSQSLRDDEIKEIEKSAEFISAEKAESIARGISEFKITSDYKLSSSSYNKNWDNEDNYTINLYFMKQYNKQEDTDTKTESGETTVVSSDNSAAIADISQEKLNLMIAAGDPAIVDYVSVTLDAVSGKLISMWGNRGISVYSSIAPATGTASAVKVNSDKAKENALKFVNKYFADYAKNVTAAEENKNQYEPNNYSYTFYRVENGVKVPFNAITVGYDVSNDKIISVASQWSEKITFESKDGVISLDDAANILFDKVGLELCYQDINGYNRYSDNYNPDIKLVYGLKNDGTPYTISAKTGKILDYQGNEYVKKEFVIPNDLEGHYAENQIKALIETDVIALLPGTTEYKPDEFITQEEFINMVVKLSSYNPGWDSTDSLYRYLASAKIVNADEKNPSAPVSREEVAKYTIRVLGHEKVAKLDDIYKCGYNDEADINPALIGYVAIAKGLKIMNGDESGNFNPKQNITRAEAAIMLYNYLVR